MRAVEAVKDLTAREFVFTQQHFERVRKRLYEHAGIVLSDHKKDMVYNRLVRRLRELRLDNFAAYISYLDEVPEEFGHFINALTTNLTAFFREEHHFRYLEQTIIPELAAQRQQRLRIWSAGCSMGEESYSIAMSCRSSAVDTRHWDIKILATDIDTKVLTTARNGVYGLERIEGIPENVKRRFFRKGRGSHAGQVQIAPEVREMLVFKELNLMQGWPMKGPLDLIFCRNVMIYFDKETQATLLDRMADLLKPNGILMVGHSESPGRLTKRFRLIGQTIYQKV